MLNARLYRAALLPALAAAIVMMFSVVTRPEGVRSEIPADGFEGDDAALIAQQLLAVAPQREPGSAGDETAADFVAKRFRQIEGGEVIEQRFEGDFEGEEVELRNVVLVLAGVSDSQVVVTAPRDCAEGTCAASSAAATAALLELAANFDGTRHRKTLVLASTDGSTAGAEGARELAGGLTAAPVEGVIALSVLGPREPRDPFVLPWSTGPESTSAGLLDSARVAVETEVGTEVSEPGIVESLFRLALPSGLGESAALVSEGLDAVGISAAGERPGGVATEEGAPPATVLEEFGRSALSLVLALDATTEPLEHGPEAQVPLAGKLIPGWAVALLVLTLLVPVAVVSADGLARASRRREPVLITLAWILSRSLPFAAALALAYLMTILTLVPDPAFPYDPDRFEPGLGGVAAMAAVAAAFCLGLIGVRRLKLPAEAHEGVAAALGAVLSAGVLAVWAVNAYLALLLVPAVHLWVAGALAEVRRGPAAPLVAALGGLALPAAALADLAGRLGVIWELPWQLLLMVTGGHAGLLAALLGCVLGGCLLSLVELAVAPGAATRRDAPVPGGPAVDAYATTK